MNEFAGILGAHLTEDSDEMLHMLKVMALPDEPPFYQRFFNKATFGQTKDAFDFTSESPYCLAYQGHIFNWDQIYEELINTGQKIEERTPGVLLLTAYQTWGPNFLSKLNGRFVLFIYDIKEHRLLIGRDKVGSNRIYWGRFSNTFLFSTSIKGLLSSNFVPQNPCLESLAAYLYLGYFPQDKTPISHLNCLLPGYYLVLDREMNIVLNKYWSFKDNNKIIKVSSQQEVNERFDHLLSQAILRRCPNDQPLACYYQGDLGSAALPHYFQKLGIQQTLNYTNEFKDQSTSYIPFVNHLSERYSFPLHKQEVKCEMLFQNLRQIIWHLDEPIADPTSLLIWNLAQKIQGQSKHLICSLGYAEFLGTSHGHNSLTYEPLFVWFLQMLRPLVTRMGIPLISKVNKKLAFKALRYYQKDFWASDYIRQNTLFDQELLKKIAPELYMEFDFDIYIHQTYQYLKYIHYQNFDISDYFFYDAETALCNHLLVQYSNLLKAYNIDLLCPFLDEDLSLFLIHTPEAYKSKRKNPALPLQEVLRPNLDPSFLNYDYQQSPTFLNHWLQEDFVKTVFNRLTRGNLCESGIISAKGLKEELNQTSCRARQFQRLWSILILEIWFQLFISCPEYKYPLSGSSVDQLLLL